MQAIVTSYTGFDGIGSSLRTSSRKEWRKQGGALGAFLRQNCFLSRNSFG